jgi:hypothetical protein
MALAQKQEQYFDEVYENISRLYTRAENLLNVVESSNVANQEAFLQIMEPLIEQIEASTNIVAADFAEIIETGEMPTNAMKRRVNTALRDILQKVAEYRILVESIEVTDE